MRQLVAVIFIIACPALQSQVLTETRVDENQRQFQLPYNRLVQPAGIQIIFGDDRAENHSLDLVLSPDGRWLAVEERYSIIFISTTDNKKKFILSNNLNPVLRGGMNTYSGIIWNNSGEIPEVWWSVVGSNDRSFVASAKWDGQKAEFGRLLEYKAEPPAYLALPNEIMITEESGKKYLYVVLNGNNKVIKQDFLSGDTIWVADPGVAPYGIAMARGKVYVTNWAGRHPLPGDKEVAGIPWGLARVNNKAGGGTKEGSVAIIDASTGAKIKDVIVGLHPNEIISNKQGRFIYITNSNSDNISVINTANDEVMETISVRLQPEINPFFGDSPNGLGLSPDEKTLYVANGMDNALAVISLGKNATRKSSLKSSMVTGFIPTGAYPSAVTVSKSGFIYVANLEGNGVHLGVKNPRGSGLVYNSHIMLATVSAIPVPDKKNLKAYSDTVIAVNDLSRATLAREAREAMSNQNQFRTG